MKRSIQEIIKEQRTELQNLLGSKVLERAPMKRIDVESPLAQAVVGMRRAGKSVVCRQALANAGVPFAYVNFDDEALARLTADDLDDVLTAAKSVYGEVSHFFFDEIQNVEGWHLFVNRLLRSGNRVVITGSNARLLTGDLATHLTGRYLPTEVLPFSFAETVAWTGQSPQDAWPKYFLNGGLPETFALADPRGYVSALYTAILTRDILGRHKVRNAQRFLDAAYVVMQQFARELSYDALARATGVSSAHTMQTYVSYLGESYLVFLVRKYARKPSERVRNEKLYVGDPAFISYFTGVLGSEEELGWRLENIVYLELLRRRVDADVEIWYYKDASYDIDFCLTRHGKVVALVQVAYTIAGEKTRNREIPPLFGAGRKLGCADLVVVTDHESETVQKGDQTVRVVSAQEWLLAAGQERM